MLLTIYFVVAWKGVAKQNVLVKKMTAALCFQGVCKDDLDKVLNDFYLLKQLIMTVVSISMHDTNLELII